MCGAGQLEEKHFRLIFQERGFRMPEEDGLVAADSHLGGLSGAEPPLSYRAKWDKEEANRILAALDACSGNRLEAAKMLQISKATLFRKIKKYNLNNLI